jgi:hypothetical protein
MAACMATSDMSQLNVDFSQRLDVWMTVSEAKVVLVLLYTYAGFPSGKNFAI